MRPIFHSALQSFPQLYPPYYLLLAPYILFALPPSNHPKNRATNRSSLRDLRWQTKMQNPFSSHLRFHHSKIPSFQLLTHPSHFWEPPALYPPCTSASRALVYLIHTHGGECLW